MSLEAKGVCTCPLFAYSKTMNKGRRFSAHSIISLFVKLSGMRKRNGLREEAKRLEKAEAKRIRNILQCLM